MMRNLLNVQIDRLGATDALGGLCQVKLEPKLSQTLGEN
jgi:hypothetical protein